MQVSRKQEPSVLEILFHMRTWDYLKKAPEKSTPKEDDLISLEVKVGCRFFQKKMEKIKITDESWRSESHELLQGKSKLRQKNTTQQRFELSSNGPKTLKKESKKKPQKDLWTHRPQVSDTPTFHICERHKRTKVDTKNSSRETRQARRVTKVRAEAWDEERLKNSETEWRRGMNREIRAEREEDRQRRAERKPETRAETTQAAERASRARREGGGRFIWSFIRGSETGERETGSRTKAIRGFSGGGTCGQKSISPPSVSTQQTQYQQPR